MSVHVAPDLFAAPDRGLYRHRAKEGRGGEPGEDVSALVLLSNLPGVLGGLLPGVGRCRDATEQPVRCCLESPGAAEAMLVADTFKDRNHLVDERGDALRRSGRCPVNA